MSLAAFTDDHLIGRALNQGGGPTDPTDPNPPNPPTLLTLQPVSAKALRESFGVSAQAQRLDMNYSGSAPDTRVASPANIRVWLDKLSAAGTYYIRSSWVTPSATGTGAARAMHEVVTGLRARNMRALWLVANEGPVVSSETVAQVEANVRSISNNAADVTLGIEGVNEPNHNRGAAPIPPVPPDWAARTVAYQQRIWETVGSLTNLSGVIITGPAPQDTNLDKSYTNADKLSTRAGLPAGSLRYKGGVASQAALPTTGRVVGDTWLLIDSPGTCWAWSGSAWVQSAAADPIAGGPYHWHQLKDNGVLAYQHVASTHSYATKGSKPLTNLSRRIAKLDDAYGLKDGEPYPTWITENGYSNAVGNLASGHQIASEAAAAIYAPRGVLQMYGGPLVKGSTLGQGPLPRHLRLSYFEGLDQFGNLSDVEDRFGLIAVSQTSAIASYDSALWTDKPALTALKALLTTLIEPAGGDYTPARVPLKVDPGTASDVQWLPIGKRDGTVTLAIWRDALVENVDTKTAISVPAVPVKVTDAAGLRTIQVDARVQLVSVTR